MREPTYNNSGLSKNNTSQVWLLFRHAKWSAALTNVNDNDWQFGEKAMLVYWCSMLQDSGNSLKLCGIKENNGAEVV